MKADIFKQKFEALYKAQADAIFRYCLFRVSDYEAAVDLSQEVFMRFWDALSSGKKILNERAFVFMIARNIVIDFYRKKKTISLDAMLDENGEGLFMADKVSESIEMSSEARFVMDKLSLLPAIHQQILYLRFVEGFRPQEIAEVLDVSTNVVSVRIIRGIEKLREITGYKDLNI